MVAILDNTEFYTRDLAYWEQADPTWIPTVLEDNLEGERSTLSEVLGAPAGRRVLDASCGTGLQALALAQLGWQVSGCDHTPAALEYARRFAQEHRVKIDLHACDMRRLTSQFKTPFDVIITCKAIDNLGEAQDIVAALVNMHNLLVPGGRLYVRIRNFDQVMADRPRYELKDIRAVPYGQVIQLEDWEYPDQEHLHYILVYLREDARHPEYWETTYLACRRYTLTRAVLLDLLNQAGFSDITCLPQASRWHDLAVIANKGSR